VFIPISWLIVGLFIRSKMHYDPCSSHNEGKEKRKKIQSLKNDEVMLVRPCPSKHQCEDSKKTRGV
jgi:hypothetical protein